MQQRTAGPKRKKQPKPTTADSLSAIAKHVRQVNAPAPAKDLHPQIEHLDQRMTVLAAEVARLASETRFNVESICAEIERRANKKGAAGK